MKKFVKVSVIALLVLALAAWIFPGNAWAKENYRTLEEIQASGKINIGVFSDCPATSRARAFLKSFDYE